MSYNPEWILDNRIRSTNRRHGAYAGGLLGAVSGGIYQMIKKRGRIYTPTRRRVRARTGTRILARRGGYGRLTRYRRRPLKKYASRRYARRTRYRRRRRRTVKLYKPKLSTIATHTRRTMETGDITTIKDAVGYAFIMANEGADLQTAIGQLRYLDTSLASGGGLVTLDAAAGDYNRDVIFGGITAKLTIRANYKVPFKYTVYLIVPRVDSNVSPYTTFTNGITDQKVGTVDPTDRLVYLTDSNEFNASFRILKKYSGVCQAGQTKMFRHNIKQFKFDVSNYDTHSNVYQKATRTAVWCVRAHGLVAHDNITSDKIGDSSVRYDWTQERKWVVKYDAGVQLNDFSVQNLQDAGTNTPTWTDQTLRVQGLTQVTPA